MLTLPFDESVVMPESQMCRKFSRECEDQKQIKKPESFSKQIVLRGKSIKRAPGEETEKEEEEEDREEDNFDRAKNGGGGKSVSMKAIMCGCFLAIRRSVRGHSGWRHIQNECRRLFHLYPVCKYSMEMRALGKSSSIINSS